MKVEKSSRRHVINRPRPRHGHKYSNNIKSVSICYLYILSKTQEKFEAQLKKKLSNTEAELKKSFPYKKSM